jgi:hypothetical protein
MVTGGDGEEIIQDVRRREGFLGNSSMLNL